MLEYFDMHCHLGFCPDAEQAARDLASVGVGAFSNTVTPAEFDEQRLALAGAENVRVGAGLHPWWVGDVYSATIYDARCATTHAAHPATARAAHPATACAAHPAIARAVDSASKHTSDQQFDCDFLYEFVARNRYIGEVGLDFSPRRKATRAAQIEALTWIANACARTGNKVLSVHAVQAVDEELDVFEHVSMLGGMVGNACILHWFSGTSDQLTRARRLGCFFSVNPRMLESKRGRAYVQAIPADKLLLETDLPASKNSPSDTPWDAKEIHAMLEKLTSDLAKLRGEDPAVLKEQIASTSRMLLDFPAL